MSIYVSIDDSYCVKKYSSLNEIVEACSGYYSVDGKKLTKSLVRKELSNCFLNVYEYDEEQLEEALEHGSVLGVDWSLKFQSI
jgi:hypothetical protein